MQHATGTAGDHTAQQKVIKTQTENRIDLIEKEINGLKDSFITLNGTIQTLTESIAKSVQTPAAKSAAKPYNDGLVKNDAGDITFKNPFDPTGMVEIAMPLMKGQVPRVMQFPDPNDATGQHLVTYNFRTDDKGRTHYFMPRMFAAAQLRNSRFVLVSPSELPVETVGPKLNKEMTTIKADPEYQPVFER